MKKPIKPLLWVLILAMSISLVAVFSSGGCRRVEEFVVEEVVDESEEECSGRDEGINLEEKGIVIGWQFHDDDVNYLSEMIDLAPKYNVNHVELSHNMVWYTEDILDNPEKQIHINNLINQAHQKGIEVFIWTHEISTLPNEFFINGKTDLDNPQLWEWLKNKYHQLFQAIPEVDGIVLTFSETNIPVYNDDLVITEMTKPERVTKVLNTINEVCNEYDKRLWARTWAALEWVADGVDNADKDIWIENKNVECDFCTYADHHPKIGTYGERNQIVEFDLNGQYLARSWIPSAKPDYLKCRIDYARNKGVKGFVGRVGTFRQGWEGPLGTLVIPNTHTFNTPNEINMYAFTKIIENPNLSTYDIWMEWAKEKYGEQAAPYIVSAFNRTFDITSQLYFIQAGTQVEDYLTINTHSAIPWWGIFDDSNRPEGGFWEKIHNDPVFVAVFVKVSFEEDFEDNQANIERGETWKILDEGGNNILDCPGEEINGIEEDWASFGNENWENYISELDFKLINEYGFGFHFFANKDRSYVVDIREGRISLLKKIGDNREEVDASAFDYDLNHWYKLKTEKSGNIIHVYIDNNLISLNYNDDSPFDTGQLRLETFGDGHVRIDNIKIESSTSEIGNLDEEVNLRFDPLIEKAELSLNDIERARENLTSEQYFELKEYLERELFVIKVFKKIKKSLVSYALVELHHLTEYQELLNTYLNELLSLADDIEQKFGSEVILIKPDDIRTFVDGFSTIPAVCNNNKWELEEDVYSCPNDCLQPYYDFIENYKLEYGITITEEELNEQINTIQIDETELTQSEVKNIIRQGLNIDFLSTDLSQEGFNVEVVKETEFPTYTEKHLLFTTPDIGTFNTILLIPRTPSGAKPAILGLHGHGDSATIFKNNYFGRKLAEEGYVVLMPSFRAMGCEEIEVELSETMLLNGFSLMGLRVYETLLLVDYLKSLDEVDSSKIGVFAHSGGSVVANLVMKLNDDVNAMVYDYESAFMLGCDPADIHCETIPLLASYYNQINQQSTPSLKLDYGYKGENDYQEILDFFNNF